jgi:hypothetical protein
VPHSIIMCSSERGEGSGTQLFCSNDEFLKRNVVERGEIFHRSQRRTFLSTLYHSNRPFNIADCNRNVDLLQAFTHPQLEKDPTKRLLQGERLECSNDRHVSIFAVDVTPDRHYSAFKGVAL